MIEILNGMKETIHYLSESNVRMYHNIDYEDYPHHWHVGIEIIMPANNWYDVIVDQKTYHLQKDEIIFIHSGSLHALKAPKTGERIILQFDISLLYHLKEFETILFMLPNALVVKAGSSENYKLIHQLFCEIVKEYDSCNVLKAAEIYSKLIQIYVLLCRNEIYDKSKFVHTNSSKQHEYIEKILTTCNYINEHFHESLTLEQVATIAGFSKFHFTRLFKELMNVTFYEYLNQRRIAKATTLLINSDLSITEICMNAGFTSLSTFNRTFKAINGCAPSEYKKKKGSETLFD